MQRSTNRSAFTILEVLVVIGIIGILIAILVPALGKARQASRQTQSMANARTIALTFDQYSEQYNAYPYAKQGVPHPNLPDEQPGPDIILVPWWPDGVVIGIDDHFATELLWPGIVSNYASWPENYPVWVSPGLPTDLSEIDPFDVDIEDMVSYRYSNSFVAKPQLWAENPTDIHENMLAAVAPHEVTFPSNKVMLWDTHLAWLPDTPESDNGIYLAPTPMAFADQHADIRNPADAEPTVANPLRDGYDAPLHNTRDGVHGRDF